MYSSRLTSHSVKSAIFPLKPIIFLMHSFALCIKTQWGTSGYIKFYAWLVSAPLRCVEKLECLMQDKAKNASSGEDGVYQKLSTLHHIDHDRYDCICWKAKQQPVFVFEPEWALTNTISNKVNVNNWYSQKIAVYKCNGENIFRIWNKKRLG